MARIKVDLVIKNCSQLLTCASDSKDLVGLLEEGYLAIKDGKIAFVGSREDYLENVDEEGAEIINGRDKVVVPGFVDCHTHLVFGGSRRDEYIAKLTMTDMNEIRKIVPVLGLESSIKSTVAESFNELLESSIDKSNKMLLGGTTTIEMKSGYGIDKDTELKQLRVINELRKHIPLTVFSTYLGGHYWDINMGKKKYIDYMIKEVMPIINEEKLAEFCDVWCDDGYYTAEESRQVLTAARDYGMESKIHTDCYSNIGGSRLAGEMKMVSADHLNFTDLESIKLMVDNKVTGVVIPGTDFSVNHPRKFNPRPMLDEGMILAIGTNLNPGNWMQSMQLSIALACRLHSMTPEEAIRATTLGGAYGLGVEDSYGSLELGKYADIQIWDTEDYRDVAYKLGLNLVDTVIKRGQIVVEDGKIIQV